MTLRGKVSYVSQTAFIMNASLKDNVLFGQAFDSRRYKDTIKACSMRSDIRMLPGGDATEIGASAAVCGCACCVC